jgi:hypothetical protein
MMLMYLDRVLGLEQVQEVVLALEVVPVAEQV